MTTQQQRAHLQRLVAYSRFCPIRVVLLVFFLFTASVQAQIPPKPQGHKFIHDRAATISEADRKTILRLQNETFDQAQIPIVVVTINRMSDYLPGTQTIERFASTWFDNWGIGSQEKNDGVLVLISTGDREGRIELGEAWGHRFDGYCKRVMDNEMIPYFKTGDYGGGIVAGVHKLVEMARAGPQSQPPEPGVMDTFQDYRRAVKQNNPVAQFGGDFLLIVLILAGIGCFIAAYFFPEQRKVLIIAGLVLFALAFVFWLVVIFIGALGKRYIGGDDGGFGGSGGGFSGGSSGGGGASGSW